MADDEKTTAIGEALVEITAVNVSLFQAVREIQETIPAAAKSTAIDRSLSEIGDHISTLLQTLKKIV